MVFRSLDGIEGFRPWISGWHRKWVGASGAIRIPCDGHQSAWPISSIAARSPTKSLFG
jgi:hypothetical protein